MSKSRSRMSIIRSRKTKEAGGAEVEAEGAGVAGVILEGAEVEEGLAEVDI